MSPTSREPGVGLKSLNDLLHLCNKEGGSLCVCPISHFGICYETNTNTMIKMNKISRLSRAINFPTMPCCVQNNLEHLISDQSVFLSLASSNSLQLSLIRQKHKLRSHKKSWRSSTDLYLLGFLISVVPSCQCVA